MNDKVIIANIIFHILHNSSKIVINVVKKCFYIIFSCFHFLLW